MNSKLNQIYQSIEDIRKALGDEAECVPIDELAGMITKLTDDPTRSGFTTTFMFSNDENPNIPQETRLNVNTGLVEDSSGWSQTDFGSATYAMRSQSNDTNWITFAIFGPDGSQKTEWSTPKNLKGEKGERGADGKPGSAGPKGDAVEYIYTVDDYYAGFAPDSENIDGYCPKGWTSKPVGISDDNPTEWVSQRTKDGDKWSSFSKPVIWAKWGYNGKDGNGVEYIYCLTKTEDRPTPPESDPNKDEGSITWPINGIWYDDPKSTSEEFPYCWVSVRKQYYNGEKQVWDGYSLPTVWARWSKDGENGGRTIMIYTRDNDINAIVNKPTNGSWDPSTNEVIDIESDRVWSTDPNDGVGKHLWQSNAVFNDFGEKISDWTSPFRMTGEDGIPGKDGETIQFIYRLISNTENFNELVRYHKESGKELSNLEVPSKIDLLNPEIDEIPIRYWNKIESGPNTGLYTIIDTEWTDDPSGISLDYQIECVCSRTKDAKGEWTKWSYPTIWSKWGEDGTDGPGVEYIYLITSPSNYDNLLYIPTYKEYQEYDKEYETNYASYFQKDDFIPGKNAILGEQNWSDEPSDVSPSEPIEWVSVRKKKDGIWGDFSKPVIWNKWVTNGASFITSYCFTRTSIPLNKYIKAGGITGGDYESPTPKDTIISVDDKEITIKWYDSVPAGEESVWMISRTFESGDLNPDDEGSVDPSWSAPSLMQDRSDFVVEFTTGHSKNPDQKPEPRNLQWAYNEYLLNGKDYISEWRSNEAANGVHWNDNIPDANWMATCHLKNGVWTDWSVVKIKGEKGDKGIDGVCTIIQGQAVIVGCIFNTGEQQLLPNNKPAKYLIQICNDEHELWIWETDHYGPKDVKIGDSYIVSGDLYVWDGDSFENVGQIQGPEGIAGTPGTNAYFYMAFSNEDSVLDRTVNTPIDLTLKTGKYVGYLSSTIALSEDTQSQSTTYNWSPWNGQDGWGYEQIFLLTKKENGIDWDNGPAVPTDSTAEKDYRPAIDSIYTDIAKGKDGRWSDVPLTPTEDYPFCWIVTRTTNGTEFGEWKGIDGKATLHNRYIVDGIGTPAYHVELTEDNVTVPLESNSTIDPDFKYFDLVATLYAGDEVIDEDVKYEYSLDGEHYVINTAEVKNRFEIKSSDLTNKPTKLYIRVNDIYYKNVTIKYTERAYEMSVSKTVVRKDWKDGKLIDNQITVIVKYWYKDKWLPVKNKAVTCIWTDVLGENYELINALDNGTITFDLSDIDNPVNIRFECGDVFEEVGVIANGEDGSRIEYIYYRTNEFKTPDNPTPEDITTDEYQTPDYYKNGWTDELTGVDKDNRYEYVSVRERISGVWGPFTDPKLHSYYAKDGEQGPVGPQGPQGSDGVAGIDGKSAFSVSLSDDVFQLKSVHGIVEDDIYPNTSFEGYYGTQPCEIELIKVIIENQEILCTIDNESHSIYIDQTSDVLANWYKDGNSVTLPVYLTFLVSSDGVSAEKVIKWTLRKVATKISLFVTPNVIKDVDDNKEIEIYVEYDNKRYVPKQLDWIKIYVNGVEFNENVYTATNTVNIELKSVDGELLDSEIIPWLFDGKDGVSIVWKGDSTKHLENPENGWAYHNTSDKASYVFFDQWYLMSKDGQNGLDGKDGKDGTSISIKDSLNAESELPTPPANASDCYIIGLDLYVWTGSAWKNVGQFKGDKGEGFVYIGEGSSWEEVHIKYGVDENPHNGWCYRDTDNGRIYVWDGDNWEIMVEDGQPGANGSNGLDGLSVFVTYNDNSIDSEPSNPTGDGNGNGWHTNATLNVNWMSQKVAATATEGEWGDPILICGRDGADGKAGADGKGIVSTTVEYGISTSENEKPTTWTSTTPILEGGKYLWTKTTWAYTEGYPEVGYSVNYIPKDGQDGNSGKDGAPGKDGVSIVSTKCEYAISNNQFTTPESWSETTPTLVGGNYLWTRTTWTYSEGDPEYGFSVNYIPKDGEKGLDGKDGAVGAEGRGIKDTKVEYAISTSQSTIPTSGWSTSTPTLTNGSYLWTRTTWTYTSGDPEVGYQKTYIPLDGPKGDDGEAGAPGVGIASTKVEYAISDSGTIKPTTWSETTPVLEGGKYLWTKTTWTYTEGPDESGYSVTYIGKDGEKGDQGDTGPQGPQGVAGSSGPVIYPEGNWTKDEIYIGTSKKAPYVMYNDECYIAFGTVNTEPIGDNVVDIDDIDWANPTNKWIKMEEFAAIYTDILFADFAKLGSWIFSGDFMFSQTGTIDGVKSNDYEKFYEGNWNGDEPDTNDCFIPNIVMNAKTGDAWMAGRNISLSSDGAISAKNMTLENGCQIGSFSVNDTGLTFISSDAGDDIYFTIDGKGLYFNRSFSQFEINENGLNYSDSDGNVTIGYGYCGIINAVTTEYKGLLNCQEAVALRVATGENRYAIENLGGMIAGLRPNTRTVTSSDKLSYCDYNIVVHGSNVTLTLPTPKLGQTYEIMALYAWTLKGNANITCPTYDSWGASSLNPGTGYWKIVCAPDDNGALRWFTYLLSN